MPIARIEVQNHKAFGQMVVNWSRDPGSRPATLDDLKGMTVDILNIPPRITKIAYVDVDLETLTIRVPNKQMVEESLDRFSTAHEGMSTSQFYPAPEFYKAIGSSHSPPALDTLFCRIADYTIAQCA